MKRNKVASLFLIGAIAGCPAQAQAPTPGGPVPTPAAPAPGSLIAAPVPTSPGAAPLPGPPASQVLTGGNAAYRHLPLNYKTAAIRLEELRNIMITAKPKEFQDAIGDYLDWLSDMADGHWKIYQAFAKVDSMKAQAEVEKTSTLKLGGLKRQALLLKAEFLIRNNRQPEALQPLIDIVVAEPKTATGEAAYALLKQIGFSEEVPIAPPQAKLPSREQTKTKDQATTAAAPASGKTDKMQLAGQSAIAH